MKSFFGLAILLLSAAIALSSCYSPSESKDTLFQTSTINTLMAGVYEGNITLKELKKHGDFGLGTFDSLDGEMIILNGESYQIKADGKVYPTNDSMKTPFAAITFFETDQVVKIDSITSFEQMAKYIDDSLPTQNIFYAVKIDGLFSYVKTRSVPRQNKPYPPLAKVTQSIFEFHKIAGTIVGFRCPSYASGVNVPGYHLHFITRDKTSGGHVIELDLQNAAVELDTTTGFHMELLPNSDFYQLDLTGDKQDDLNGIEKGTNNR
jgi:acetolactate decarboxylase